MKGSLSLRGFRKLRTGAIVATGVFLIGLASIQTTVQASEEDGVWIARTVEQVKADIQKEDNFFKYEIKWGDTLSVISEATNIPVDVLKEMNRISDRNLFLPHNELLYTEGESVTDSKTKHKIIIKESYGNKEVRTYEVVLQKNHETAEVSFELKETTEKVQTSDTSVVCYGEVYNLVSDQVEGATETPTPAQPAETTPTAPGATEMPTPTQPAETTPAGSGATETLTPAQPKEEQPTVPGTAETPTPAQSAEEHPAAPGATETPTAAQPAEEKPATSGTTETPAPAQPAETTPVGSGTTETPAPAQPAETTPAGSGATETPAPAQPAETTPAGTGTTETPAPAQPAEEKPATSGTTETPAPTKPAEDQPATSGATETPAPAQPAETTPAGSGATETPAPAQPAEEKPATSGATETPAPAQPAETTPAGSEATETPTPAQPAETTPAGSGATETPTPAQPAETTPAGSEATETPASTKPAEEHPAAPGTTETPTPAQPAETTPTGSGATETPTPAQPADSNNQNNPTEPKDDVEKGLEENNSELDSRKNIKLEEIESSSLPSSEKEAAKLKVEEYTNKAKEAMKQAKTTDDQAAVVDNYSDDLATINTPGVDQGKPDYTNSGLSGNGPEGTHIGDNNAIGHGNSTPENTGFRNAPVYQPRVTRRARSVDEPMDKVAIYYNYTEMKDIAGFLGDPGETVVTVPKGSTHEQVQAIVKSKIDEKKAELAKRGYTFLEDYFVDKPQDDTIRYDYIVNFTKPSSLRMAPTIQPRASRTRRSIEEPKVKTRTITLYYQLAELEIAGSLGNPGQNYVITVPETATAEEIQQAIDQQTSREKASLSRYFQYVGETNLQNDILDRGFGNFDYVITFARRK